MLYVIGGGRVGGMETHLLHLLAGLDRTRFSPLVCCLNGNDDYRRQLTLSVDRVVNLGVTRFDRPRGLSAYVRGLWGLLAEWKPDIVQTYGYSCDFSVPLLARLLCPETIVVTTRRGEDDNPRHQLLRKLANTWVHTVVCVSASVAEFTEKTERIRPDKLRVIPNAVRLPDPGSRRRQAPHPLRFGTLGTLKPVKGTDLLVDAFLRFQKAEEAELWIAGGADRSPAWAERLIQRAERSRLAGSIKFLGHQHDPVAFLRSLDVFVLPSRSEGMSNALLEAMALGLPCIATDVGSNRELLLGTRQAGIVCEPKSDEIFEAMVAMSRAGAARADFGHAARMVVEQNYSLGGMVRAYEELYASFQPGRVQPSRER